MDMVVNGRIIREHLKRDIQNKWCPRVIPDLELVPKM